MNGSIFVINYMYKIDFPNVQVDVRQPKFFGTFPGTPDVYIIDATDMKLFLKFRNKMGFKTTTKYIIIGKNASPEFPADFSNKAVFINTETGEIHNENNHGNCFKTENFTSIFKNNWKRKEINVCINKSPPYTFENDTKEGIDIEILKITCDLLKIDVKFLYFSYPVGNLDAYFTNVFAKNICDVYNRMRPRPLFDFTHPYLFDTLHWVTKTPEQIPRWKYAFKIFTLDIWLSCIFSTTAISLVWHLTTLNKTFIHLPQGFLITLKLFLEQSYSWKTSSVSRTIMFINVLFTSFMINAFYKSRFTYLLSGFNVNKPIDSFEAIMANKMFVILPYSVRVFFEHDPKANEYFKKYQIVGNPSLELHKVPYKKNTATALPERIFYWRTNRYINEDMRPLLQIINPSIVLLMYCMILPKGSPLVEPLKVKLGHLQDHGHISYILSKYKLLIAVRDPTLDVKKLTIDHMQLPLALWIIGIIVASIIFLYESKLKSNLSRF
ncbi:hypothetical protein HHI36_021474 [Cryptolaemus montrouzieri]|uniref:Ionotropic receptor n=1 Tax=Cryptolaemus montrouzieri TaxID=559131 RepID=A0ABD2MXT5_9CUCU